MVNNPQRSALDYVHTDIPRGTIDTSFFHIEYDTKNFSRLKRVRSKIGPRQSSDIFDTVYTEISMGIVTNLTRISLNNFDNFKTVPLAAVDGPIRSTMMVETRFVIRGLVLYRQSF